MDAGVKDFKKKFTDKTKNKWENRANFEPAPGKYTLLEMDDDDDGADEVRGQSACRRGQSTCRCTARRPSQIYTFRNAAKCRGQSAFIRGQNEGSKCIIAHGIISSTSTHICRQWPPN